MTRALIAALCFTACVAEPTTSQPVVATAEARPPESAAFSDEGHGFVRPQNSMAFNAVAEAALAKHLGGRFEPVGDDFAGSTIAIKSGAEDIPGLPKQVAAQ